MGYFASADYSRANKLGEELETLAASLSDPLFRVQAHSMQGISRFNQGEFERAHAFSEQAIALYDPQQHPALVSLFTENSGVVSRGVVAWALWMLGYPDQSLQQAQDAQRLATDLAHPFSLNTALLCSMMVHEGRREVESVNDLTAALMSRPESTAPPVRQYGFAYREVLGMVWQSWACVEHQPSEAALEQLRQGLVLYQAAGVEVFRSHALVLLASIC